ncbi:metalloprotease MmpA [Algimonas ampicilliniresistens]|uniref:Metalloprotease MmpA n=1 Tax=Algimonas ampicilliniresistens TaxID=1298735 RepID=A0ABQ5V8Y0_9PROT|nr:M50 family metallopeptidase [Algimonas ampicilliniresistens]GLQ23424.1 metalloprotease MmpA [Algimonas ampicilliniresistens]
MLTDIIYIFLAALTFFGVISALIFFHELGHYSVARFFGIRVERFSIGFGRAIYQRKAKSGTNWMISRIPLGGYVKFAGDAGAASNPDAEALEAIKAEEGDVSDIFHFRPVWQRALVVLAGPVANFILAVILFAIVVLWVETIHPEALIGDVEEGSPAAAAGVQSGDRIVAMDGRTIRDWVDMSQHIQMRSNTPIETVIERGSERVEVTVTPRLIEDKDFIGGRMTRGQFGVSISPDAKIERRHYSPVDALVFGSKQVVFTISSTGHYIGRIFTGKEDGEKLGSIGRIATMVGKSTVDVAKAERPVSEKLKAFALRMLQLGAAISVALGFANLIPIPMLDGGHLVFYAYEAIAGKPLSQKKQELGFRLGMAVLLALFVVLTINDIGYFRSL